MVQLSLDNVCVDYPLPRRLFGRGAQGGQKPTDPRIIVDRRGRPKAVRALNDFTLDVTDNQRIALVGHNGAGKTTLLRVLSGVLPPTAGKVHLEGEVEALLNLGIGMRDQASGYDNIMMIALMRGYPRAMVRDRMGDIASFSGLDETFLQMPVESYSSGMRVRLLFSTITAFQPNVLLLDEWFGTADREFSERAQKRVEDLVGNTGALVLASHAPNLLKRYCDTALWLDKGRIRSAGDIDDVLAAFREDSDKKVS